MTTLLPDIRSSLLDIALEVNSLPTLEAAQPLLTERAQALIQADTVSLILWNDALTVGRVCAATGHAAERRGALTQTHEQPVAAHAVASGRPQFGRHRSYGYTPEVDAKMNQLQASVSVPIAGADRPVTIEAGWLTPRDEAELTAAASTLTQLATLTAIGRRTTGDQERREDRARLDAVLDAAGDGILILREGGWFANATAQRLLELPDDTLPPVEQLNARRLDGTPIASGDGLDDRFRARVTSLGGRELVIGGSCSSEPVPVIVFRDITDEHRREHSNEQFLRSLLDTIPTAICVVEVATRRVLSTNRAFLELIGREESEVIGAEQPYPWWSQGEQRRPYADGDRYARVYRHAGGTPVPVEIELHGLTEDDGTPFAQIGVITDQSERRRFERQLVQSGKLAAIGELAAGVAHEVNNPLFAILGLVEFLLKDAEQGTKAHERLQLIQSTANEIKEIVRSLLDFARERSDEFAVVDLADVIRETVKLLEKTTAGHGVEIVEEFADGPFPVDGSSNQLKQIFLNLIGNARQAMPAGGRVVIQLTCDDEAVTATVRDHGPGIPPEHLQRIFEPFFTTKRATGGTGLGLSVSVGIAENHGGSLTATSTTGEGAAFIVRLPRHAS